MKKININSKSVQLTFNVGQCMFDLILSPAALIDHTTALTSQGKMS